MKKVFLTILILTLLIPNFLPLSVRAAAKIMVDVAEGPIDMEKTMADFARQARPMCDNRGGYFDYYIAQNSLRIEIDPQTGLALGMGDFGFQFTQNCPGMPLAKLIKGDGMLWAHVEMSGFMEGNTIRGSYSLGISLPTLVAIDTDFPNLSWTAQRVGGYLQGSLNLRISQFNISGQIPFYLPIRRDEAQFITGLDREALEIKGKRVIGWFSIPIQEYEGMPGGYDQAGAEQYIKILEEQLRAEGLNPTYYEFEAILEEEL